MGTKSVWLFVGLLAVAGGFSEAGSTVFVADGIASALNANVAVNQNFAVSGPSETTFGSVETAIDAFHQPWQWSHIPANRGGRHLGFHLLDEDPIQNQLVWAQIGNIAASDSLGLGYLGNLGKGYLGAQLFYDTDKHDFTNLTNTPSFVDIDQDIQTQESKGAYIGFGWTPNDNRISHGFGVGFNRFQDNFTDTSQDTFGGFEFMNNFDTTNRWIQWGTKFKPSDRFSYTLEAKYYDTEVNSLFRNTTLDDMGIPIISFTNGLLMLDGDGIFLSSRLNWYNGPWDHQVRGFVTTGNIDLLNVAVEFEDFGGTITPFNNVTEDTIDFTAVGVGGKVAYHEGPLHVFGGVDVWQWMLDIDVLGDFNSPMTSQYRQIDNEEVTTISPNVSILYEFNDRWSLTVGARYQLEDQKLESQQMNIDVMMPSNNSTFTDIANWKMNETGMRAGLEFRTKKAIIDITAGSTTDEGRDVVDPRKYRVSVRLGF